MKKLGFAVVLVLILFSLCLSRAAVQLTPPAQPIPATQYAFRRGELSLAKRAARIVAIVGHFDAMA